MAKKTDIGLGRRMRPIRSKNKTTKIYPDRVPLNNNILEGHYWRTVTSMSENNKILTEVKVQPLTKEEFFDPHFGDIYINPKGDNMEIKTDEHVMRRLNHKVVALLEKTLPESLNIWTGLYVENWRMALVRHAETGDYKIYYMNKQYKTPQRFEGLRWVEPLLASTCCKVKNLKEFTEGHWYAHERPNTVTTYYNRYYKVALHKIKTKWNIIMPMPQELVDELDVRRFVRKLGAGDAK